jgi:signal transduction histidine kinase
MNDARVPGSVFDAMPETERIQLLYRNLSISQLAVIVLAGLLVAATYKTPAFTGVWAWGLFMVAVSLFRWRDSVKFKRGTQDFGRMLRWYRRALVGTSVSGAGWAFMSLFYFPEATLEYQVVIIFFLAGVSAGAVSVLSCDLRLYLSYSGLVLVPLLVELSLRGGGVYYTFALATLLYMLILARSAIYVNHVLVENIRGRVAKEAALNDAHQANEHLRDEIEHRRQAEKELVAARDAAEAASKAKSEFLSIASHEIRTPMNGVLGMLHLALRTDLTDGQRKYLTMAMDSASGMMTMLNDVLQYAALDSNKIKLEADFVAPSDLVAGVVAKYRPAAEGKRLELVHRVDPDLPQLVRVDAKRLREVFGHLLDNAIKFTREGGVEVRLESDPEQPGSLCFSVKDTGVGIPEDKQAQIFEAFTQVDGGFNRQYGGLGLGLALAKRLAALMGGRIGVESRAGEGSTFRFAFPYET